MSKTPFEIRLELLKMAREMMELDYMTEKDTLQQIWHAKIQRANETNEPLPDHPSLPTFPKPEEIIKKAQTLNTFISNG